MCRSPLHVRKLAHKLLWFVDGQNFHQSDLRWNSCALDESESLFSDKIKTCKFTKIQKWHYFPHQKIRAMCLFLTVKGVIHTWPNQREGKVNLILVKIITHQKAGKEVNYILCLCSLRQISVWPLKTLIPIFPIGFS